MFRKFLPGLATPSLILGAFLGVLSIATTLRAQRVNSLGATIDVVGSVDNSPEQASAVPGSFEATSLYSLNPSLLLTSEGARSRFTASYAFGWNRLETGFDSNSHIGSLDFTHQLAPTWNLNVANFFSYTNDARSSYALRGVSPEPDSSDFELFFYPVAFDEVARDYNASVGFDHRVSGRSTVSFGGGFYLRNYGGQPVSGLSDQKGGNATFTFTRQISEHTSWFIGYNAAYYTFDGFSDVSSSVATVGLSRVIAKDTTLSLSAGASYLKNINAPGLETSLSHNASAGITKTIKGNNFSLSVSQDGGQPSGAGSVSLNRRFSLGFSRDLGRFVNIFADASGFDSRGVLDNTLDTRGGSATANAGFAITRKLSLQVGGQFQRYARPDPFAFTQKRLFVSIRYSEPALLRSR